MLQPTVAKSKIFSHLNKTLHAFNLGLVYLHLKTQKNL